MSKTIFIKEGPDSKGRTYIIEGEEKTRKVLSVKRFICEIVHQENEQETQEVADLVLNALKNIKQ